MSDRTTEMRPARPGPRTVAAAPDLDEVRSSILRLAERFRPQESDGLRAVYVVAIDGHPPYALHVGDGRVLVSPATADHCDVRFRTDPRTWLDLVSGRRHGIAAFLANDLLLEGDTNLAVRFETLFTPGPEATRLTRTNRTNVRGVTVESIVAGVGTPVVLIHGLAAHKITFAPTFDALADGFEVHALDLPGFGKSDKPLPHGRRYSPRWFADVVHGYLVRNRIRSAYVIGNSMGGRVAAEVALRHPDSVRGVVCLGAAVAFDEWQRIGPLLRLLRPQWLAAAPLPVRAAWLERGLAELMFHDATRVPADNLRVAAEEGAKMIRDRRYRLAVAAAARHLAAERSEPFWEALGGLDIPSYWIWGASDRLVSHRYNQRVRQLLPHAQVEVWEGVGHVPQFEVPARTNAAIGRFLGRLEAGYGATAIDA